MEKENRGAVVKEPSDNVELPLLANLNETNRLIVVVSGGKQPHKSLITVLRCTFSSHNLTWQ